MFRAYRIDIKPHMQASNDLTITFRSLRQDLAKARPASLENELGQPSTDALAAHHALGSHSRLSPPVTAVGPWRAVRLEYGPVVGIRLPTE